MHPGREREGCTEGGEALLQATAVSTSHLRDFESPVSGSATAGSWYAVWTHSHCEKLVHDQLALKGYRVFLPTIDVWSRRRGVRRLISTPMFPAYLFLQSEMDKATYLEVCKVRGVARLLGERWDRLTSIPEEEMQTIEIATASGHRILPCPYLKEGQRARITAGPLAGVEGILVETRPHQGLLVLSIHMLQRSVAVVVDGTAVRPM